MFMTEKEDKFEKVKRMISEEKKIQSDNPQVEMTRQKLEAILRLADHNNDVFSELKKDSTIDETLLYSLAKTFASAPMAGLEGRLRARGITNPDGSDVRIEVRTFDFFLREFLIRRHSMNRGRVDEYLQALKNITPKSIDETPPQKNGLLQRMV